MVETWNFSTHLISILINNNLIHAPHALKISYFVRMIICSKNALFIENSLLVKIETKILMNNGIKKLTKIV